MAVASVSMLTTRAAALTEARSHRDELLTFATVLAVGRVEPARCLGMTSDAFGVWDLSQALHVELGDDTVVDAITDDLAKTFGEQADKAGAKAWCDDVYAVFGAEGTLMRGLLH